MSTVDVPFKLNARTVRLPINDKIAQHHTKGVVAIENHRA
jgi:hypothetical protein